MACVPDVDEGLGVADIARDREVTEATLYRWRHQALIDRGEVNSVRHRLYGHIRTTFPAWGDP
ncbi:transposase [Nocardia sp. GTS18]|uniref:transposase n=1 Tax=Nocardia sp. GTS18 TaxID=1778064 RepID=UPI0015EFC569